MRALSPSAIKGSNNQTSLSTLPRPGSKNREVYDALYEARGRAMDPDEFERFLRLTDRQIGANSKDYRLGSVIRELVDYWGCDIRKIRNVTMRGRKGYVAEYCLVGEWSGKVYLDYTREAREQACQDSSGLQPGTSTPGS